MRCEEVRQLVSPYLDSELDDRTIFLIGRHLDDCPECASRFKQEQDLELAITKRLRGPPRDGRRLLGEQRHEHCPQQADAAQPPVQC